MARGKAAAFEELTAPVPEARLGDGETAAALAEALAAGDLLHAAADESTALSIARALAAAVSDAAVIFCPGSDALPGDDAPASPANVGQRAAALRRLRLLLTNANRPRIAVITTGEALGRAYPPPAAFEATPPRVAVCETVDLAALAVELAALGYIADERVDEPGEVALRGQVLDVFPADAVEPIRIEAADGVVVAIRTYDPVDQRTTAEIETRELGRVSEPMPGRKAVSLLDHVPGARLSVPAEAEDRRRRFRLLAADASERRPKRAIRDVLDAKAWIRSADAHERLTLASGGDPPPRFVAGKAPLREFAKTALAAFDAGDRVVLLGSPRDLRFLGRRVAKALQRDMTDAAGWADVTGAEPGALLALAMRVDRGFRRDGVLAVTAADLLGSRAERDDASTGRADTAMLELGEIRVGDFVVHEDHGIAVVAGLETIDDENGASDAMRLTFANDAVRLVPVAELDHVWRYGAAADAVTLDKLDGSSWRKRRGEIDAAIAESARGLTALAKEREGRTAPVLAPDAAAYERFASGFPFTETIDQARAIEAVRADLGAGTPMDRLVIGDVGYGKTEVALRAAAIAALAGRQVAVIAPTTVLARQHLESFAARFEEAGIAVAGLSRLSTTAEKKRIRAGLADGSIELVVGTSAVAAKGIAYKDLALVVIDEEQRFGAADKKRLRELSAGHVLTLSATPIPRTLQSALVGLQQVSVIATPPARRQPIRTAVGAFVPETVRTALLRERSRGGQSFVVVPRIEDMAKLAGILDALVPNSTCFRRTARCLRPRSTRRWSGSAAATATSCSPPTSSKPGSTCRAPTRW